MKAYTHQGNVNDLSSFVRISNKFSIALLFFSYYFAMQFRCKVLGVVAGLEPVTSCQYVGRILQVAALSL